MFVYGTSAPDALEFKATAPNRPFDYLKNETMYIKSAYDLVDNTFTFYTYDDEFDTPVFSHKLNETSIIMFSFQKTSLESAEQL